MALITLNKDEAIFRATKKQSGFNVPVEGGIVFITNADYETLMQDKYFGLEFDDENAAELTTEGGDPLKAFGMTRKVLKSVDQAASELVFGMEVKAEAAKKVQALKISDETLELMKKFGF